MLGVVPSNIGQGLTVIQTALGIAVQIERDLPRIAHFLEVDRALLKRLQYSRAD